MRMPEGVLTNTDDGECGSRALIKLGRLPPGTVMRNLNELNGFHDPRTRKASLRIWL